ncbi:MAG TPA: membrane protein insertion efficiency factor YidD [Anaeromyxobacter sp.]
MAWATIVLASALAAGFGPFATPRAPVTSDAARVARDEPLDVAAPVHAPWRAYRATVGAFQGARCPHVPSCSLYAARAVDRYGLLAGGVVAAQRLLRGPRSSALRALPRAADGRWIDRLDDATFWLGQGRR